MTKHPHSEHPIDFGDEMVRAILRGSKTQTRRVMNPQPSAYVPGPNRFPPQHPTAYFDAYDSGPFWCWWSPDNRQGPDWIRCPCGIPGDRLWVREIWGCLTTQSFGRAREEVLYRASDEEVVKRRFKPGTIAWKPSIHLPRKAARITLDITRIRVERLQAISDADAHAEGVVHGFIPADEDGPRRVGFVLGKDDGRCVLYPTPRRAFEVGWDAIDGKRASWASNPWVWVVEFERVA